MTEEKPAFEVTRSQNAPLGEPRPTILEDDTARPVRTLLAVLFLVFGSVGLVWSGFIVSVAFGCWSICVLAVLLGVVLSFEEV